MENKLDEIYMYTIFFKNVYCSTLLCIGRNPLTTGRNIVTFGSDRAHVIAGPPVICNSQLREYNNHGDHSMPMSSYIP